MADLGRWLSEAYRVPDDPDDPDDPAEPPAADQDDN
jgi:endogenous inhibitor of DNA gyrase (YacG/DUF329 family)